MVLKNASNDKILESITQNCIHYWQAMSRSSGQPKGLFNGEVEYIQTGIPIMMFNPIFDGKFQNAQKSIPEVVSYYKENKIPMMWMLSPLGKEKGYGEILENQGLELAKMQIPGMAADLSKIDIDELKRFVLRENVTVTKMDENLVETHADIFLKGFNQDYNVFSKLQKLMHDVPKDQISTYLASYGDVYGSISSVFYSSEVAGIYDVATLHEMRGKGLGTAVVAQCMIEAKKKGYEIIILQSTPLGHPIYVKLGFKDYFIYDRYLLRPENIGL